MLGSGTCLVGPYPGRVILAQGDDVAALEAKDAPGKRVADAAELSGAALATSRSNCQVSRSDGSRPDSGCGAYRPASA
jgi:hypothetical protein